MGYYVVCLIILWVFPAHDFEGSRGERVNSEGTFVGIPSRKGTSLAFLPLKAVDRRNRQKKPVRRDWKTSGKGKEGQ